MRPGVIGQRPSWRRVLLGFAAGVQIGVSSTAQTHYPEVKLVGVVNVPPEAKRAILTGEFRGARLSRMVNLAEGEREGPVKVLQINPQGGTAEVCVYPEVTAPQQPAVGTNLLLTLPIGSETESLPSPTLWFNGATINILLDLYAHFANRTLLRHPVLPNPALNLRGTFTNFNQAAAVLEQAFAANDVILVPDGPKFTQVLSKPYAKQAVTNAPPSGGDILLEAGHCWFSGASLGTVAGKYYAPLLGRTIQSKDWFESRAGIPLFFFNETPLSRAEFQYALETLFGWSGVKFELEGDTFLKPLSSAGR